MPKKDGKSTEQHAGVIRAFLAEPLNKQGQRAFVEFCYAELIPYLQRLRSLGWRLPTNQVQAENALPDMASDILGFFLASKKGRPHNVIFDYFERHRFSDFEAVPDIELITHIRVLLCGFTNRRLARLLGDENPQIKNLKRRIDDVLRLRKFRTVDWPGDHRKYVFAVDYKDRLRHDQPVLVGQALLDLVSQAFQTSHNRSEWLMRIFELLNDHEEFCNALPVPMLKSMMIAVNANHADVAALALGHMATPREVYLRRCITEAIDIALQKVTDEVVAGFVRKGRLAGKDKHQVLAACRIFLVDRYLGGAADSIPSYFRTQKPGISQNEYLKKYKFVMDTVIERAGEIVREYVENDPTIRTDGDY